jgi:uncharacterized protein with NAD-binding domain and iron-sulfur cluster
MCAVNPASFAARGLAPEPPRPRLSVAAMSKPDSTLPIDETSRRTVAEVVIFGAGMAGLTAAHELAALGYKVRVYEASAEAGGFFRSARHPGGLPSEYSWHGMGPWYHNAFDLLKQIPFDDRGSIYDRALSRPIDFGIFPDDTFARFYDHGLRSIPAMFRFSTTEAIRWAWLMLKTWASNRRTEEQYSRQNAADRWRPQLGERAQCTWRSCFGPWIGSDWTNVSLHHAGQFFRKQLITQPTHHHRADEEGPAWQQGAGDGWLLLRGPSSEYLFDRWLAHLRARGVEFHWSSPLAKLNCEGGRVSEAHLQSGRPVHADHYILATTPFAAAEILARTPAIEREPELAKFRGLIQDGPHVQVSFRLAFAEPIRFPRPRTAMVLADTEFNLTLFAVEQVWRPESSLGAGVLSLWTGTSCVATVPGRIYGRPVATCTREQFIEEVKAQIFGCTALNNLVAAANGGRRLTDFALLTVEVWHEWEFSSRGIRGPQPKWVTTTHTQPFLPNQVTSLENLFLAGAHTRTEADVWSIEGAVESGRRAARGIDARVPLLHQYRPAWLRVLAAADDPCYRRGWPHALDLALGGMIAAGAVVLASGFIRKMRRRSARQGGAGRPTRPQCYPIRQRRSAPAPAIERHSLAHSRHARAHSWQ